VLANIITSSSRFFAPNHHHDSFAPEKPKIAGKAAIVAAAHNLGRNAVQKRLAPLMQTLGNFFDEYQCIIVESNSQDDTRAQLLQWQTKEAPERIKLILEEGSHDIAYWRNLYLSQVKQDKSFVYMIVIDADMVSIDTEGVGDSLFNHDDTPWAALVANGQRRVDHAYYDILALRAGWNGHSFWTNSTVKGLGQRGEIIRQFTVRIDSHLKQLIPVESGFGGVGVYKTKYLQGCEYCRYGCAIKMSGGVECEHVPFHACIARNDGSIFINPRMVTTWHYDCADCCSDLKLPCFLCKCAAPLESFTWDGITHSLTN